MPRTKRSKALYARGKFRLDSRPDRDQLVITWYDPVKRRERSASAGTGDVAAAKQVVDRMYLESEGTTICPTCGQQTHGAGSPLVFAAIQDYLVLKQGSVSYEAIKARLAHVATYLDAIGGEELHCHAIDETWIEQFRQWMFAQPVVSPAGRVRDRAPGTVENSVVQLRAAIAQADQRGARFSSKSPKEVNRSPTYRADIPTLARMFTFALQPRKRRETLLAFLRFSVLTLCRPDAALDASTAPGKKQWDKKHHLFNLLPVGRRQTTKYRPTVPIAKQGVDWLNSLDPGPVVASNTIKTAWTSMAKELKLPGDGEAGTKLIRRSMAVLLRRKLGIAGQGEVALFLGHDRFNPTSGIYAPTDTDYLINAKHAIEEIIDAIELLAPGAFYRTVTADGHPELALEVA